MSVGGRVLLIDGEPAALRLATSYLAQLFSRFRAAAARRAAAASDAVQQDDERMESIAHYVHDRYAERLSVSALARRARMGRSTLSRRFSAHFRVCIRDYIAAVRIAHAVRLLLHAPDLSITDIALKVGFYDLPRFDKVFRRVIGSSPSEYRRMHAAAQKGKPPAHNY
jgi:transcriptional regulator GlxA family with amidase domain